MADRPLIAHHRASAASGVEMMSTQVHNRLSSSRFINMCVANWFLHILYSPQCRCLLSWSKIWVVHPRGRGMLCWLLLWAW